MGNFEKLKWADNLLPNFDKSFESTQKGNQREDDRGRIIFLFKKLKLFVVV